MKYSKIIHASIIFYGIALAGGCIVAYFDVQYTKNLEKYDFLCIGVLLSGFIGLIIPFAPLSGPFPEKTERVLTRVAAIIIGLLHFFFLKQVCTSSHPDNSYLAMRFFYFFVAWYSLTIFIPRTPKNVKTLQEVQ